MARRFLSRRSALELAGGVAGAHLLPAVAGAGEIYFEGVTPNVSMGPFYPLERPLDADADLTRIRGRKGRAQGEILELVGRVLTRSGKPLAGASVEIWQADTKGRYVHPHDPDRAEPDVEFQGYGMQTTDAEGRYRFRTVKPAPYRIEGTLRTPHVHFQVSGGGERKVTQMFFPGESLNEQDQILSAVRRGRERLIARVETSAPGLESGAKLVTFDILLMRA